MELVWNILNSPAVIAFIASALVYGLNKLYAKKPTWAKYEGAILAAIKLAEKEIPDGTDSKSLKRLDAALAYVLKTFELREGRAPSVAEKHELVEGINLKHDESTK